MEKSNPIPNNTHEEGPEQLFVSFTDKRIID